jgi:transcriptional regulator with XRE-family HTH domain
MPADKTQAHRWQNQFGQRLRALREREGLTQMALAEVTGLHATYISGIERGKRNVSLVNIHTLSDALGVPVSAMFPASE